MNRRDFLTTASGVSAAAATASAAGTPAAAESAAVLSDGTALQQEEGGGNETDEEGQDDGGNETEEGGQEGGAGNESEEEGGGGGAVEEVTVGPGGDLVFDPADLTIEPGTTVHWVWDSDDHNVAPTSVPDDAEWEGHPDIVDTGTEYEHTFEVEGTYEYVCDPHASAGMEGTITVEEGASQGGGHEFDPEHLGVPIQKHFIGAATFAAIFVTLVFTFYVLKYGESPNTSYPNKKD